jgi:hypothetical protein
MARGGFRRASNIGSSAATGTTARHRPALTTEIASIQMAQLLMSSRTICFKAITISPSQTPLGCARGQVVVIALRSMGHGSSSAWRRFSWVAIELWLDANGGLGSERRVSRSSLDPE